MRRRRNPFPGVATVDDRHGKRRHRLRRIINGRKVDAYLPGPYGSPTFRAAYNEAVEGARVVTRRSAPGTVGYLLTAYLESTAFRNLSEATRRAKRSRLDWIREAVGQGRYAEMELFLGTGAARQDAAALTRGNIRGDRLHYRRGKTGQEVDLPILPELAAELVQIPARQLMLIGHGQEGRAYAVSALGNAFRDACAAAGLPHCSAHGLRKAGARRLAEAGATEFEVMSFLAHRNTQEASRYTAAANRAKLTSSGMAKLEKIVQPFRKLDNSGA